MIFNGWNKPAKQCFVEMGKGGGFTQREGNEGNLVGQRGERPTLQHAILVRVEEGESAAEDRPAQKQKTDPEVGFLNLAVREGFEPSFAYITIQIYPLISITYAIFLTVKTVELSHGFAKIFSAFYREKCRKVNMFNNGNNCAASQHNVSNTEIGRRYL